MLVAPVFFAFPAFPFCVMSFSIAFFSLPPFPITAVLVGHTAGFGAPIRSFAFSLAICPYPGSQNQNDRHYYPFCACPSHDIVLSFGGI